MGDLFLGKIQIAGETCELGFKLDDGEFPKAGNYYVNFVSNTSLKKYDFIEILKILAERIENDLPKPSVVEGGKQKYSGGMDLIPYIYDKKRVYFFEEQL